MLDTEKRQNVVFFTGKEVEKTIMFGQNTLFVVGTPEIKEIESRALDASIRHIYFGTSQSFVPTDLDAWDHMIRYFLSNGYYVTLDFDVAYAELVSNTVWNQYPTFIAMISAKMPNILRFNANSVVKIDDLTWGHSNTGVWTLALDQVKQQGHYTDWAEYVGDSVV